MNFFKKVILMACVLCAGQVWAEPLLSDKERIARLEQQVAELTQQMNRLLAERRYGHHQSPRQPDAVHVCTLKAFTQTYRSEHSSRGQARLNVLKQCRREQNEMFCQDKDVSCTTYQ